MKNFKFSYIAVGLFLGSILGLILTWPLTGGENSKYQIIYIILCFLIVVLTTKKVKT